MFTSFHINVAIRHTLLVQIGMSFKYAHFLSSSLTKKFSCIVKNVVKDDIKHCSVVEETKYLSEICEKKCHKNISLVALSSCLDAFSGSHS